MSRETIFALATPYGKSGVAIIRLSGRQAAQALVELTQAAPPLPNQARLAAIQHPSSGAMIDRGIVIYFQAPHSFTGEDVVELQLHGSLAVIRETLDVLAAIQGLRPAEPGEFSRRAFLNGKMDLLEAEGLADLIAAETREQKAQALHHMDGGASAYYKVLRKGIIHQLAHLEAYIDFPDEEIPDAVLQTLAGGVEELKATIRAALDDQQRGERLREGFRVVILGAPNAGKSSLLNALARRDAAIVSHRAGTTRDAIEVHLELSGYPVILVDTAGLRETEDEIESEGISRALAHARAADLKLVLFDGASPLPYDEASLALMDEISIPLLTKSDIGTAPLPPFGPPLSPISAATGDGIDALLAHITDRIARGFTTQPPVITRARHRALLSEALEHLSRFSLSTPLELACEELRLAAAAVGKITGKIQVDEVLDVVFREFCIGK